MSLFDTAEGRRLREIGPGKRWRRWGPYLSERQWGTVREDYSANGTAWDYFPHDHARSRAYRWGEDGLGGFSDDQQTWCLSLGLWNERDPILKERMFGLTNGQGNHGEDVKERYYYLDGTPTHSYMKMLYCYPQSAFPYDCLLAENSRRGLEDLEFELEDTGVFADGWFDVVIEYAKAGPDDVLLQVTATNRGPREAPLHMLPQLWSRNTWSWDGSAKPRIRPSAGSWLHVERHGWRERRFEVAGPHPWLFCDNETNVRRHFGMEGPGAFKDAFHDYVVHGDRRAVSMDDSGTKCAAHAVYRVPAGGSAVLQARLRTNDGDDAPAFDGVLAARRAEADAFHAAVADGIDGADAKTVHRQAMAGLLWTKQFYHFDVRRWMDGDPAQPAPAPERRTGRNRDWRHLNNADVLSMPDTWEYPWYAAWDLAFHAVAFAEIDPEFAKRQLRLLTREWYMHPNGQLPAYEWAFGDVNPPVHAWAALRVYLRDGELTGTYDRPFLERVFHKLMLNFNWWVNRKDPDGRNVFQGGFLGLDNIGLFDRSRPLPTGGMLDQADGTAWMAMYALNLMRIALTLARDNHVYEDVATKFFEHFLLIAETMQDLGDGGLWDEKAGFYFDVLRMPDGSTEKLRIRSLVGLIPLLAVEVLDPDLIKAMPGFAGRLRWMLDHRADLASLVSRFDVPGEGERQLLSLLRGHRVKALLRHMLDPAEFLSDFGIRSMSRAHEAVPYVLERMGQRYTVDYVPGEGRTRSFGGNSNWRGPIWMPLNFLLIDCLWEFHRYYGAEFRVECPVGSGDRLDLGQVAGELSRRLTRLFLRGVDGRRPAMAGAQHDEAILFHEYFHGDTGRGMGAAHQTGWTALVALLLRPRAG